MVAAFGSAPRSHFRAINDKASGGYGIPCSDHFGLIRRLTIQSGSTCVLTHQPHPDLDLSLRVAIREQLTVDGLVNRYDPEASRDIDGLPPGEGAFLPCTFWLVDCLVLLGWQEEARELFERLLALRTPLGLLAEEYDCGRRRLVGDFPQAFSHVALNNSAQKLSRRFHCAEERSATAAESRAR